MRALTLLIVLLLAVESVSILPSPSGVSVPAQEGVTAAVGFEPTESGGGCGLPRDCHRPTPPLRVPVQPLRHVAVGAIVTPIRGTATYCAPTPRYCQNWQRPKLLGAVRSFRWGDRPYRVTVWHKGRHVTVTVVSHCACPNTLIDLSVEAFLRLAPLERGRIPVSLTGGGRASVTPPPTDIEGELP